MPLQFKIFTGNSGYFDKSQADVEPLFEKLELIKNGACKGRASESRTLGALKNLAKEVPSFFPVYLAIASYHLAKENAQATLDAVERGLASAHALLPEDFDGLLEWHHPENREYLTLIGIGMVACMLLRRHDRAVALGQLCVARNPSGLDGSYYLLASEALRAGKVDLARDVCRKNASTFPILHYELGLSYIMEEDWVSAATALRKGFVTNPYFQAAFTGVERPAPRVYHHRSKHEDPEAAMHHFRYYGELWSKHIKGLLFMDWLYDHPKVTAERARFLEVGDALLWADGGDADALSHRQRAMMEEVDDRLSIEIVRPRTPRNGPATWPWLYEHDVRDDDAGLGG